MPVAYPTLRALYDIRTIPNNDIFNQIDQVAAQISYHAFFGALQTSLSSISHHFHILLDPLPPLIHVIICFDKF